MAEPVHNSDASMSASQACQVSSGAADEAEPHQATELVDIYHRPNASSQYNLLYRAPKQMLINLAGYFHTLLVIHNSSFVQLTSGERLAFIKILNWMTTFWNSGRENTLYMGTNSIATHMRLRYMASKLDCPVLLDDIAKEITSLLECGMSMEEMDMILDGSEIGTEDWDIVVEYAATEVFKRRVHIDDYYDLFEKHEGLWGDVRKAVDGKRDERDQQVAPPSVDGVSSLKDTYRALADPEGYAIERDGAGEGC